VAAGSFKLMSLQQRLLNLQQQYPKQQGQLLLHPRATNRQQTLEAAAATRKEPANILAAAAASH
jgi:hypothetical protein